MGRSYLAALRGASKRVILVSECGIELLLHMSGRRYFLEWSDVCMQCQHKRGTYSERKGVQEWCFPSLLVLSMVCACCCSFVGEVTRVNPTLLKSLVNSGYIPVVATVATDEHGQALNVNADTAAGEVGSQQQLSGRQQLGVKALTELDVGF